jgi:hypothetical protein
MEASGCRIVRYRKQCAEFSIYDVADQHLLNRGVSKSHILRDVMTIKKDPYALWFEGGDYADWINTTDKRFDPSAFDEDIKVIDLAKMGAVVTQQMLGYYKPIRKKCLGMLIGNHEFKYMSKQSEMYIHEFLCSEMGVPDMKFSGFTDIYFVHDKNLTTVPVRMHASTTPPTWFTARLRVFIHHGMGAANTAGGKINKLKALVDMVDADLVMMAHVHEQFAKQFLRMVPNADCSSIGQRVTMGIITGSYLRTYAPDFTGYGEMKGYNPAGLGASRARYIPETRTLTVENRADNVGMTFAMLRG